MTPEQEAAIKRAKQKLALERAKASIQPQAQPEPQAAPRGLGHRVYDNLIGDPTDGVMSAGEKLGTLLNKGGESMTGGLVGDGTSAAIESLVPGVNYAGRRDHYRGQQAQVEEQHPALSLAADIGGALLPIGGAGLAARGAGLGRRMLASGAAGAAQGGAYGFAEGEGADRPTEAVKGAAIGAGAGLALPPVAAIAGKAISPIKDAVLGALGHGNTNRANRAITDALTRSGKSADDVQSELAQALAEGQGEYVFADALGNPGQRQLSGIARRPGEARSRITEFLETRQQGQPERLAGFVSDSFGFRGSSHGSRAASRTDIVPMGYEFIDGPADVLARPQRSAEATTEALKDARSGAANKAYGAARAGASPVDVRGALAAIDDRIGPMQGSGVTGDGIDAKLSQYRNRLAAKNPPNGEIARELSDFDRVLGVKQDIQDDIGAAVRAGRNNEARLLGRVMRELDGALEESSEGYRKANDDFAQASKVIGAVDEGAAMARPRERAADTTAQFQRMTPSQQDAARIGYGDSLLAKIEGQAGQANRARPLTSPKMAQERMVMALDPDRLQRRIDREKTMFETRRQATGGSQTADNMADQAESAGYDMSAIGNLLTGNFRTGSQQLLSALSQAAKGQNEETRSLIAQALLSRDPEAVLRKALKQADTDSSRSAIVDALLVAAGSRGGYSIAQNP